MDSVTETPRPQPKGWVEEFFEGCPVIPVLTLDDPEVAVALSRALAAGGLTAIEVTLRTDKALDCIRAVARDVPGLIVGAGTIRDPRQIDAADAAGARFLVSPGATDELIAAARGRAWLPGIGTVSEAMRLAEAGFRHQKFFPAEASGGLGFLRSVAPVLRDVQFCPTGGIDAARAAVYLQLGNVFAVGGSWVAPAAALDSGDFQAITCLAREAAHMRA